jgi:hypothetical protein
VVVIAAGIEGVTHTDVLVVPHEDRPVGWAPLPAGNDRWRARIAGGDGLASSSQRIAFPTDSIPGAGTIRSGVADEVVDGHVLAVMLSGPHQMIIYVQ